MARDLHDNSLKLPDRFIRMCKWFWKQRTLIWGAIILNLLLGTIVSLLFTDPSTFKNLPIGWIFQNPLVILIIFLIMLSVTLISGITSRLSIVPSKNDVKRHYFTRLISETELLTLKGIPAGLISASVRLDEVFIPSEFRLNRPLTDYPLTESELDTYRNRLKSGTYSETVERVLVDAERNWQHVLKDSDRISIGKLWQQLDKEFILVIQGYPGMGKSTFLERLTLHMARRGLNVPDPNMPEVEVFQTTLIPILIRLGEYASERIKFPTLSLSEYISVIIERLHIPELNPFILASLREGSCLVMLDGLDEVSDPKMRAEVQIAIKTFIHECRAMSVKQYNRFLITSRVAGYDQAAFPDYSHFTLAELTTKQIDYFLPCWCHAHIYRDLTFQKNGHENHEESIAQEVNRRVSELKAAIIQNDGVRQLAENPLLLTLLAVMQQNSIVLPRQRVELYSVVTRTLLENRNIAKSLEPIPEVQAIQRLGPIAFEMQETGNSFASEKEVMDSLILTISKEGVEKGTPEQIQEEAENFLKRIRERGGLFVQRTGDFFGFMHRTFQEYFAARYILNGIKHEPVKEISELVLKAQREDALWREPFLLAVAYQSSENENVASEIIRALLAAFEKSDDKERERGLLLTVNCIIESRPLTIDPALEKQIAIQLLQMYQNAQWNRKFDTALTIQDALSKWFQSLPKEIYRPAILTVFYDAICNVNQVTLQRATLTILNLMFMTHEINRFPPILYDTLIPPLLGLTGLPAVGKYQPMELANASDMNLIDLAAGVLCNMAKLGPAGLLLADVRQYFKNNPKYLHQLARYSLERRVLITLVNWPSTIVNSACNADSQVKWISLMKHLNINSISERDFNICLEVHQTLLECTEEVNYPAYQLLINILQVTEDGQDRLWQQRWREYVSKQMISANHILLYQEAALLWTALFPEQYSLEELSQLILEYFYGSKQPTKRFAQRFLARISCELRDKIDIAESDFIIKSNISISPENSPGVRPAHDPLDVRYLYDLCHLESPIFSPSSLNDYAKFLDFPLKLKNLLLTKEVAYEATNLLTLSGSSYADQLLNLDLITIVIGRIIQIRETAVVSNIVEEEIEHIAHFVIDVHLSTKDNIIRDAILDALFYLPCRTEREIKFVLQLAENAAEVQIQNACAKALASAIPQTPEARAALELTKQSSIQTIRSGVEAYLEKQRMRKTSKET